MSTVVENVPESVWDAVAAGAYHAPHDVLGPHPLADGSWAIRARRPMAKTVTAITATPEMTAG